MTENEEKINQAADAAEVEEETEVRVGEPAEETPADDDGDDKKNAKKKIRKLEKEISDLQGEVKAGEQKLAELNDQYVRLYAEYDNFRKRSAKEREGVYTDAYADAVKYLLPIIDNLERAEKTVGDGVGEGLAIIMRSAQDALSKMGITEIPCETFDPNFHNAVFHVEDESYGENVIVEVLQKGYMRGDRVIRYAMVKVAN